MPGKVDGGDGGLTNPGCGFYEVVMNSAQDPEDRLIRFLLIGGASFAVLLFLVAATVVTVLISMNFNVLEWME